MARSATHSGEYRLLLSKDDAGVVYVRPCLYAARNKGKRVETEKSVPHTGTLWGAQSAQLSAATVGGVYEEVAAIHRADRRFDRTLLRGYPCQPAGGGRGTNLRRRRPVQGPLPPGGHEPQ